METIMPYLLPLLLLPLSLYLIFFIRKKGSDDLKNLPPGSDGWPILGEYVEYSMLGTRQLVSERMQKYSPEAFKTSLFGEKMVVLCGAEGNKMVYKNENKLFRPWLPISLGKLLFPEFVRSGSRESLVVFHNMRHEVLKPEALRQYIPMMDALAREQLDDDGSSWRPNSVVKAFPWLRKFTFDLTCRVLMNVVDPEMVDKLQDPFDKMTNGTISMAINLPGTAFNRAMKGGKVVHSELMRIIKERTEELKKMKNKESEGRDVLSRLLSATTADGHHLCDDTMVAGFLIGLLDGGQYETSSAIALVLSFLADLPHIYDGVFKEQMEIAKSKAPNELLTWEDIEKMKYTWNVVRESFRLTPPTLGSFREATTDLTFAGFTIPKGRKVLVTAHTCHMNPDYFPEPEKFDPSRFEGSGPAPYTYVPFGGGPKMCPGQGFVKLVIMVFIHNVVTRFRLEKVIPDEKMVFHVTPIPSHGLPLRLHPHQN
ncbi:hypothetical protein C2S53_020710 [Perilla frutescens var. hirtella]|uniref:Cytochrome P450 n=1 Tax=Perilla frutescens var. hirtella TaxID=608512 RepID=A0AAD4IUU5_PERFH|nr:hypothetical protein C2S53_020710 [Perilla frutescens var. hirtella]